MLRNYPPKKLFYKQRLRNQKVLRWGLVFEASKGRSETAETRKSMLLQFDQICVSLNNFSCSPDYVKTPGKFSLNAYISKPSLPTGTLFHRHQDNTQSYAFQLETRSESFRQT